MREAWGTSSPTNSTWPSGTILPYVSQVPTDQSPGKQGEFGSIHTPALCPLQAGHINIRPEADVDLVTGLKQKTNYGRPAWDKEFEQVRKENPT